jgi:hypothetical protein
VHGIDPYGWLCDAAGRLGQIKDPVELERMLDDL